MTSNPGSAIWLAVTEGAGDSAKITAHATEQSAINGLADAISRAEWSHFVKSLAESEPLTGVPDIDTAPAADFLAFYYGPPDDEGDVRLWGVGYDATCEVRKVWVQQ